MVLSTFETLSWETLYLLYRFEAPDVEYLHGLIISDHNFR